MTSQQDPGSAAGMTKIMKIQFPHFHRGKPAWIFSSFEMLFLWALLIGLVTVNLVSVQKGRPAYWNKLMMLFEAPFSVPRSIDLASLLWKQGRKQEARQLMASARSSNVLGATTDPMEMLTQWELEAEQLKERYAFWQTVAAARPDYRDAFVILAATAYQLEKPDEARVWLTRAFTLDPNSPTIQALAGLLEDDLR